MFFIVYHSSKNTKIYQVLVDSGVIVSNSYRVNFKEDLTMKHKHYEMIVAKAANMDLVRFYKCKLSNSWKEIECEFRFIWKPDTEFFLCLPEHKEACLHWLNGGAIQDNFEDEWTSIKPHNGSPDWNDPDNLFMNEEYKLRIKTYKEKRWIAIDVSRGDVAMCTESSVPALGYQIIEIEVEI